MNTAALDALDFAVAAVEAADMPAERTGDGAKPHNPGPYHPSRDPHEIMRLIGKYISKIQRVDGGWVAIGFSGRAYRGVTLPIAVCKAVAEVG
jgi:hypothetical protein